MKRLLVTFLGLLPASVSLAQQTYATTDKAYVAGVEKAFAFMKQGRCDSCLAEYRKAFAISQKSALSTLRAAACAYQCGQDDQAVTFVNQAARFAFWEVESIWANRKENSEFDPVRSSFFGTYQQEAVDKQKIAVGRNPQLERDLAQIFDEDQHVRLRADTVGRRYGFNSPQIKPVWEAIRRLDSVNLPKVEQILKQHGYPGKRLVGEQQSVTAWLVIQHSPLAIQEKYLPLLQAATDRGDLAKANLALLIDRIRVFKGQKQLYGSQVKNDADGKPNGFHTIEDEANVNKRRAEMGLEPLEEYAKRFGFTYQVLKN